MKIFKDLKIGDRIYNYQRMQIGYYIITNIDNLSETSVDYTWDHKRVERKNKYTVITYKNSQGKENTVEFDEYGLNEYISRTRYGSTLIFSDKEMAIKYVTDLYNYRVEKLKKLKEKYDKEYAYVEKYKECFENIPD